MKGYSMNKNLLEGENDTRSDDWTTIMCDNPEVVKAFAIYCAINARLIDYDGIWTDGDTELFVCTWFGIPHKEVMALSKRFPDDVITCQFRFEKNHYSETHIVEYRQGEYKYVDIVPDYVFTSFLWENKKDHEAIREKVVAFCRTLDKTIKNDDGSLYFEWFPEEVSYKFEYAGHDGKKFTVEAIKNRYFIDIKVNEVAVELGCGKCVGELSPCGCN
jgi:hypothetical protein